MYVRIACCILMYVHTYIHMTVWYVRRYAQSVFAQIVKYRLAGRVSQEASESVNVSLHLKMSIIDLLLSMRC